VLEFDLARVSGGLKVADQAQGQMPMGQMMQGMPEQCQA
jgi:hypothetical protein